MQLAIPSPSDRPARLPLNTTMFGIPAAATSGSIRVGVGDELVVVVGAIESDGNLAEAVGHRAVEPVLLHDRPFRLAQQLDRLVADRLRGLAQVVERDLRVAPPRDRLLESRRARFARRFGERAARRECDAGGQRAESAECFAPRDVARQSAFCFVRLTACDTARAVSAMYVMLGFWQPLLAMHAPSVMNRFFTSHA